MHCVSSYPCNLENINFPRLEKLKTLTIKLVTADISRVDDAIAAITLGASYEKHFTIDKDLPGRDNKFAILPNDFHLISKFRDSYLKMSLDKGLDLQDCEKDIYNNYEADGQNKIFYNFNQIFFRFLITRFGRKFIV